MLPLVSVSCNDTVVRDGIIASNIYGIGIVAVCKDATAIFNAYNMPEWSIDAGRVVTADIDAPTAVHGAVSIRVKELSRGFGARDGGAAGSLCLWEGNCCHRGGQCHDGAICHEGEHTKAAPSSEDSWMLSVQSKHFPTSPSEIYLSLITTQLHVNSQIQIW